MWKLFKKGGHCKVKAREIKKKLRERYDNLIIHYEETQKEHYNNSRIMEFKIVQLEGLMYDFFGIDCTYNKNTKKEDDVPF